MHSERQSTLQIISLGIWTVLVASGKQATWKAMAMAMFMQDCDVKVASQLPGALSHKPKLRLLATALCLHVNSASI